MSTVQPPSPPSASVQSAATSALAITLKAPVAISQLIPGQSLLGSLTAQPQANQIQVQTTLGLMTLQTQLPIPNNAVLALVVSKQGANPTFIISEINGKPVPSAQNAAKLASGVAQTPKVPPPVQLAQGMQMAASLLRPAAAQLVSSPSAPTPQGISPQAGPTPTAQTPSSTPAGQVQGTPTVTSHARASATPTPTPAGKIVSPATQASPAQQPIQTGQTGTPVRAGNSPLPSTPGQSTTPSPIGAPASQGTSPQGGATPTTLPSGTRFNVSVTRIDLPSTAPPTSQQASGPGLAQGVNINGTVRGMTPQGQPIVQSANATLALDTRAQVLDGTKLALKIESPPVLPRADGTSALNRAGPADTLIQAKSWPSLDEALKALSTADPGRFQQVVQNTLPQTGAKLTTQMLFFLNALKGGDFKAWMGDNASRVIERERPGLLTRLGGEFQIMSKMADEPQQNDWRLALVPFLNGERIDQVRMYYRGGGHPDEDGDGKDGTRFVLDVELSRVGHVQIDGLVKSEQKRMDLIIRTQTPLDEEWRTDIGEIFVAAQQLVGLDGGVAFQAAPGNFVDFPPVETIEGHPGLFA